MDEEISVKHVNVGGKPQIGKTHANQGFEPGSLGERKIKTPHERK